MQYGVPMETVQDWRRWFRDKGLQPVHVRKWTSEDEEVSSGGIRTDDGHVWAWSRRNGTTEAWPADADDKWDTPEMEDDGMLEASDSGGCIRILEMLDPWENGGDPDRVVDRRRDKMLRDIFG